MDDGLIYGVPTYVTVSHLVEVAGCLLVVVACLTVLRDGWTRLVAAAGALLAGVTNVLSLVSDHTGRWAFSERFWELTAYGRSVGYAVLALALLLALLRSRTRTDSPVEN